MERFRFSEHLQPREFSFAGGRARLSRTGTGRLRIELPYAAAYGCGERFGSVDHRGKTMENQVMEHFCHQGEYAYCPAPFFFTDSGFGLFAGTEEATAFTFGEDVTAALPEGCEVTLFCGSPEEIIREYMSLSGPAALPPRWAFGPWISANRWNSQADVQRQLALLERYGYPASVLVMEAWSDEATFYAFHGAVCREKPAGEGLCYEDFTFPADSRWPDPRVCIEQVHEKGLRLVLWQIPAYKQLRPEDAPSPRHEADCRYAESHGLCLQNEDGSVYRIPPGHWFEGSMVPDFFNPETRRVWFGNRQYLLSLGVDGFKTDGGEFLYREAVHAHDGRDGKRLKNRYAQSYVEAYREFAGPDRVLFSRAGYTGQHTTPILWAGDQQSENGELQSVLRAGLSAALSGIPFWGFDIAGFAGPMPSLDLYRRATQLACFCPVMQWHSEPDGGQFGGGEQGAVNERSPWNVARFHHAPAFVEEMRFWHRLRMNLLPYLYDQAVKCAAESRPMLRPLCYAFPALGPEGRRYDEYLLGESLLVCPVLEENAHEREVYLPDGEWYELFTGRRFAGGQTLALPCGDRFPIFLRGGYALPLNLGAENSGGMGADVGNGTASPALLTVLTAGEHGVYEFYDSPAAHVRISWQGNACQCEGTLPYPLTIRRACGGHFAHKSS